MEGELTLRTMAEADVPCLTEIMTRAFNRDSQLHLGEDGGPDGYDDGSFLRKFGVDNADSTAYTVLLGGKIVGAVILWLRPAHGEGFLGCIFLDDSVQDRGLGVRVWRWVEQHHPAIRVWTTETPLFSHRNHHFYINKLGFHAVAIDDPKDWREGQFRLRKELGKA